MSKELLHVRQAVLVELQRARSKAVRAGFDDVVQFLDESIYKMRGRIKALIVLRENAQFATRDNRPDNQAGSGAGNE